LPPHSSGAGGWLKHIPYLKRKAGKSAVGQGGVKRSWDLCSHSHRAGNVGW